MTTVYRAAPEYFSDADAPKLETMTLRLKINTDTYNTAEGFAQEIVDSLEWLMPDRGDHRGDHRGIYEIVWEDVQP